MKCQQLIRWKAHCMVIAESRVWTVLRSAFAITFYCSFITFYCSFTRGNALAHPSFHSFLYACGDLSARIELIYTRDRVNKHKIEIQEKRGA